MKPFVMGTSLVLEVDTATRESGVRRLEEMVRIVEAAEAELSTWLDTSDLSRLNRQAVGESVVASQSLCRLLGRVVGWTQRTNGAFDPAIGPLIDVWVMSCRAFSRRIEHQTLDALCSVD